MLVIIASPPTTTNKQNTNDFLTPHHPPISLIMSKPVLGHELDMTLASQFFPSQKSPSIWYVKYNFENFVLQTPVMHSPSGVSAYSHRGGPTRYSLDLSFKPDGLSDAMKERVATFKDRLICLEDRLIKQAAKEKWVPDLEAKTADMPAEDYLANCEHIIRNKHFGGIISRSAKGNWPDVLKCKLDRGRDEKKQPTDAFVKDRDNNQVLVFAPDNTMTPLSMQTLDQIPQDAFFSCMIQLAYVTYNGNVIHPVFQILEIKVLKKRKNEPTVTFAIDRDSLKEEQDWLAKNDEDVETVKKEEMPITEEEARELFDDTEPEAPTRKKRRVNTQAVEVCT